MGLYKRSETILLTVVLFCGGVLVPQSAPAFAIITIVNSDGPAEGFSVGCYHESRVSQVSFQKKLAATGMERMDVFKERVAEVEAGKIALPVAGQMQYSLSGDDVASATQRGQYVRMPYATSESTGLPTEKGEDGIWLMQEGTNRGHVMIVRP